MNRGDRRGIVAGGNFIVDHVKMIDVYPQQEMLAGIDEQTATNGGGPYNLLTDLAKMRIDAPLEAIGRVGDDANGRWILDHCRRRGINTRQLQPTAEAPTSYTDVMTVATTGRRTFFHQRGANALLDVPHFDFTQTRARIFHLAYLLLLDRLDTLDDTGKTGAARVLADARSHGLITSADAVSVDHPEAARIITAAARHLDHLVLNEVEAGRVVGQSLRVGDRIDIQRTADAARRLLELGVGESVVIHFVEGAVACDHHRVYQQGSVCMPAAQIRGSVGAGDAFAAGYLWAVHENQPMATRLQWAVCTAASSLREATASDGVLPLTEARTLADAHGYRESPARTNTPHEFEG